MSNKLLFFASDFNIGLSQVLTDQLVALNRAGADYIAVAGEKEQEAGLSEILKRENVTIERINGLDIHRDFGRLVNEISALIKKHEVDIVHCQNNWQLAIAYVCKLRLIGCRKLKIAYTLHGFRNNSKAKSVVAQAVIGSALFIAADYVICMTEYLKRKFGILSYKIKLLPLGVNESYYIPGYIPPAVDTLRLVFPAQFRPGKNHDLIIRSFADYVKAANDEKSVLVLPGFGKLMDEAKRLAAGLGISKQVEFPGFLSKEDVKKEYLKSNIAIVASNSETFGQCIVEPFVLGRCVITTPVGIAPEIINDGINGYLFDNGKQLVKLLIDLSKDKYKLRDIGHNNFKNRDMFSWPNVTARYIELLGL